ncbi:MAG: 1-(5-phosphoribosyl)-5-[(5-phosphoribosylamino) methylideneamino] imidazole-4-carboxamide isomerase [Actinomycetota bacterium]
MGSVDLYPAIDLRGGRVVRLRQGDYADETVYGDDPIQVALSFADEGAPWIHIVDLDAARTGTPVNRPVIGAIAKAVSGRAKVQTGGGVRSLQDVAELASQGISRVVMGSAAVADPSLVAAATSMTDVAVGLDHRDGELAIHGWTKGSGVSLTESLSWFPTAAAFVITDISRDGMLLGPDIDGLRQAVKASLVPIIASGGVSSLQDLKQLCAIDGLSGVITGKALYEGCFTVLEALAVLRARDAS